jgi:hypothetical protein
MEDAMATADTWLQQFTRASFGTFRLSPHIERQLSRRALAARDVPAARDALFVDLSAHLAVRTARFSTWNLDPWEFDDVLQESYLIFVDIHALWCERVHVSSSGEFDPSFVRALLRLFPLRLADRVDALLGTGHAHLTEDPPDADDDRPDPDSPESDVRTRILVESIYARLRPRDAITFRLMLASDFSIRAVARQTGEHTRTLYHRWERISAIARAVVNDTAA